MNKGPRRDASVDIAPAKPPTSIVCQDYVFDHLGLTEEDSNGNITERCLHCKRVLRGLKVGRAKAHFGKVKGKRIESCGEVPKDVYELNKAPALVPAVQSSQSEADQLF